MVRDSCQKEFKDLSDHDNRLVTSRVAHVTYGVVCALPVDEDEEGHNRRKDQWEIDPTGDRYLPGCFEPIIRKVGFLRLIDLQDAGVELFQCKGYSHFRRGGIQGIIFPHGT